MTENRSPKNNNKEQGQDKEEKVGLRKPMLSQTVLCAVFDSNSSLYWAASASQNTVTSVLTWSTPSSDPFPTTNTSGSYTSYIASHDAHISQCSVTLPQNTTRNSRQYQTWNLSSCSTLSLTSTSTSTSTSCGSTLTSTTTTALTTATSGVYFAFDSSGTASWVCDSFTVGSCGSNYCVTPQPGARISYTAGTPAACTDCIHIVVIDSSGVTGWTNSLSLSFTGGLPILQTTSPGYKEKLAALVIKESKELKEDLHCAELTFHMPLIIYSQRVFLGSVNKDKKDENNIKELSNGEKNQNKQKKTKKEVKDEKDTALVGRWNRGPHDEIKVGFTEGVLFIIEQYENTNLVTLSNKEGSYVRAASFLPYVVLEFGATRATATAFQLHYQSSSQMVMTTQDSKGGMNTWVRAGDFVYLVKGDHRKHPNAIVNVVRHSS